MRWAGGRLQCWLVTVLVCVTAGLFILRIRAPSDLMDYGQESPVAYVLDMVLNHHWIVQWDVDGTVATKPPLLQWLGGLASLMAGTVDRLTVALPSALATLALALLIFFAGQAHFGTRAGFLGAMSYLLSTAVFKQVALVRTDGLFSLGVAATAMLVFRAWRTGTGWTAAWLAAATTTLTKGPLGLLLAAAGLLASIWERKSGAPAPVRGSHWRGVLWFAALAGGWFALASLQAGPELARKLFAEELIHHAITSGKHSFPGEHLHQPPLYFLSRFAPWSLFACIALWRVVKEPIATVAERRFERFLFCWFAVGLIIFSVAPHQRADLVWPLLPPAAILAGRELARLLAGWSATRLAVGVAAAVVLGFGAAAFEYFALRADEQAVVQAAAMEPLARKILEAQGDGTLITHVNSSVVLQMHLGTMAPGVSLEEAAALLSGSDPAFVAVHNVPRLQAMLGAQSPLHVVAEGPETRYMHLRIVSNYPRLERPASCAVQLGAMRLHLQGVRHYEKCGDQLRFEPEPGKVAVVLITNEGPVAQTVRITFSSGESQPGAALVHQHSLAPGTSVQVSNAL